MEVLFLILQLIAFLVGVISLIVVLRCIPTLRGSRAFRLIVGFLAACGAVASPVSIMILHGLSHFLEWGSLPDSWAIGLVTVFLLELSLAMLWVGWGADPSRGRARCPRCWYDMAGAPTPRCPECGHLPRKAAHLYRTRASKKVLATSVAALLASGATLRGPAVMQHGWEGAVPSTLMIATMPWLPEHLYFDCNASLWDRRYNEELWTWQARLLEAESRWLLAHASDYTAIDRSIDMLGDGGEIELGPPAVRRLYADLLGDDATAASNASSNLDDWDVYLPDPLPASIRAEFGPKALAAIRTGYAETSAIAAKQAVRLGVAADDVAVGVIARVEGATTEDDREVLMDALSELGSGNVLAWAHLMEMARADDPMRRELAMRPAPEGPRGDLLFEALEAALDSEYDTVVLAASVAILNSCSCKQPCDQVGRLLAVASQRLEIHDGIVEAIVRRGCDHPEVTARVIEMLRDPNLARAANGARITWWMDKHAAELLPIVESVKASLIAAGYEEQVERAIRTLRTEPEVQDPGETPVPGTESPMP